MSNKEISRRLLLGCLGGGVASLSGCTKGAGRTTSSAGSESTDKGGTEYSTIVIFRNDDPAPWADLEVLSAVTDIFIRKEVPLTQGVVPYDEAQDEDLTAEHEVGQYLNSVSSQHTELFENALHGYTHARETDFYWGSEFGDLSYEKQKTKITNAVRKFEDCFGKLPETFIPPYNTYDETTVRVLAEKGFETISGSYYFQKEHFGEEMIWEDDELVHVPTNLAMEDSETGDVKKIDDIKQEYDNNKENYHLNVIMLHYNQYPSQSERQVLEETVQYALDDDSKCMTLGGFVEKIQNRDVERTEEGWLVKES